MRRTRRTLQVIAEHIKPLVAERKALQFEY